MKVADSDAISYGTDQAENHNWIAYQGREKQRERGQI